MRVQPVHQILIFAPGCQSGGLAAVCSCLICINGVRSVLAAKQIRPATPGIAEPSPYDM